MIWVIFRTFHFLCNSKIHPISKCYITLKWKVLLGEDTLAYWVHLKDKKKTKGCEYDTWAAIHKTS